MPIPQPAAELWPEVRALSGWPQTDEDRMRVLAEGWRRQGDGFIQAGAFQLTDLEGAWPDEAGVAYRTRAGEHLRTATRTAERDELVANVPPLAPGDDAGAGELNERIRALEYLRDNPGEGAGRRYLIGLDPSGDGQAIVSIGNPDTATDIATVVPGTFARLGSIQDEVGRAERLSQAAAGGAGTTATIAWIGYDAPDYQEAAFPFNANNGEEALARFQDGLRASHEAGTAHQTVIAHSYGTVLAGQTARDLGLNADDLILVAAPGTGANTVDELHLDGVPPDQIGQHVHAITSPDDWIRHTHLDEPDAVFHIGHGLDPTRPEFGAHVLDADNGSRDEHNGYFDEGTDALALLGTYINPPRPG